MREFPTPIPPLQASCPSCWKAESLCVCESKPEVAPRLQFLILQHPKESKSPLGSARLLSLACPSVVHRVGLSWRSLSKALGEEVQSSEWGVLYLGTQKQSEPLPETDKTFPMELRDRKGKRIPGKPKLRGIVLLDGNWKQAKTLWWRNPWLLKLNRVLLNPVEGSHYGTLRRQPRPRCLSTLEAAAHAMAAMGQEAESQTLLGYFDRFLEKARTAPRPSKPTGKAPKPSAPPPPAAPSL
jgi:DTW domain-containing protein